MKADQTSHHRPGNLYMFIFVQLVQVPVALLVIIIALGLHNDNTLIMILMATGMAALGLLLAWGLWHLKRWAYWTMVIELLVGLLASIAFFIVADNLRRGTLIVQIFIEIGGLLYLLRNEKLRQAFRRP